MLVADQIVEVKINSSNIKHYRELGYECINREVIKVPIAHLTKGSNVIVEVKCDFCGDIIRKKYNAYNNQHTYNLDCCKNCCNIKKEKTSFINYGVSHPAKSKEIKDKKANTSMERYGHVCSFSAEDVKCKIKTTNLERYGVEYIMQSNKIKEKYKNSIMEKYGVENPMQLLETIEKSKATMMKRYGVEHALLYDKFKVKANTTMSDNNKIPISSQQIELHKLIQLLYPNAILNYICGRSIFDIVLLLNNNIKIDIEYDGFFWHKNQQQRDRRRDEYFKSKGWKVLRVKSGHKLPSTDELFDAIDYLINTEHHYKEIILDDWKLVNSKIETA